MLVEDPHILIPVLVLNLNVVEEGVELVRLFFGLEGVVRVEQVGCYVCFLMD